MTAPGEVITAADIDQQPPTGAEARRSDAELQADVPDQLRAIHSFWRGVVDVQRDSGGLRTPLAHQELLWEPARADEEGAQDRLLVGVVLGVMPNEATGEQAVYATGYPADRVGGVRGSDCALYRLTSTEGVGFFEWEARRVEPTEVSTDALIAGLTGALKPIDPARVAAAELRPEAEVAAGMPPVLLPGRGEDRAQRSESAADDAADASELAPPPELAAAFGEVPLGPLVEQRVEAPADVEEEPAAAEMVEADAVEVAGAGAAVDAEAAEPARALVPAAEAVVPGGALVEEGEITIPDPTPQAPRGPIDPAERASDPRDELAALPRGARPEAEDGGSTGAAAGGDKDRRHRRLLTAAGVALLSVVMVGSGVAVWLGLKGHGGSNKGTAARPGQPGPVPTATAGVSSGVNSGSSNGSGTGRPISGTELSASHPASPSDIVATFSLGGPHQPNSIIGAFEAADAAHGGHATRDDFDRLANQRLAALFPNDSQAQRWGYDAHHLPRGLSFSILQADLAAMGDA